MDMNSLADWSLGVKVVLCDVFVTRGWGGAYMPSFGMCAVVPTPQGGAYIPSRWRIHAVVWHERVRYKRRKLARRFLPASVSTDSGWNCTPSTFRSLCLSPMMRPSGDVAETSRQGGRPSRSTISEW